MIPQRLQMDPKSRPESVERVFWKGSKEGPKRSPSPGPGKVIFSAYLLHVGKVRYLRKGSFWDTMLESILERKL